MKKSKILMAAIMFIIIACVLSCNDQENLAPAATTGKVGAPKFDGTEGDPIDLTVAKRWTSNFRAINSNGSVQAHYFGNEIIQQLLDRPGCVGIRMYYAIDDAGERKLLLIGVDSKGENIMPSPGSRSGEEDEDPIVDFSFPCPSYCPSNGL